MRDRGYTVGGTLKKFSVLLLMLSVAGCSDLPERLVRNDPEAFRDFQDLTERGREKIVGKLTARLGGGSYTDKCETLYALGKLNADAVAAVPAIAEILAAAPPLMKSNAAYALTRFGPPAVPALTALLGHEDPETRKTAAWALGRIGPPAEKSVPALAGMLGDKDSGVGLAAVSALGRIRPSILLKHLHLLAGENIIIRRAAAASFARIPPVEARKSIPHLIRMLRASRDDSKFQLMFVLGRLGSEASSAVSELAGILKNGGNAHSGAAAFALAGIGVPAVPALIEVLEEGPPSARGSAAWALGEIGPRAREAIPALVAISTSADRNVRMHAVTALSRLGGDPGRILPLLFENVMSESIISDSVRRMGAAAVPALLSMMREEIARREEMGPGGRSAAVSKSPPWPLISREAVLYGVGAEAIPYLLEIAGNPGDELRPVALRALGKTGPRAGEAVPLLIEALEDPRSDVKRSAITALGWIGPASEKAVPPLSAFLENRSDSIKEAAAEALGRIGPAASAAVPPLERMLSAGPRERLVAALALWRISRSIPALSVLVSGVKPGTSATLDLALESLKEVGPPAREAVPRLRELMRSKDFPVRKRSLAVLASIGPGAAAALPEVLDALKTDGGLGGLAAETLGNMGPGAKRALPVLRELLEGKDEHLRKLSLQAAAGIGQPAFEPLLRSYLRGDPWCRLDAAEALAGLGPEARPAIPFLVKGLLDAHPEAQAAAERALKKIDTTTAAPGPAAAVRI